MPCIFKDIFIDSKFQTCKNAKVNDIINFQIVITWPPNSLTMASPDLSISLFCSLFCSVLKHISELFLIYKYLLVKNKILKTHGMLPLFYLKTCQQSLISNLRIQIKSTCCNWLI
jgi:hypothetical protein